MSVTDTYVFNDIIYKTLENGPANANFPNLLTEMFDAQQIIDTTNRVQQNFMLQTGMIVTRTTITPQVGKAIYDTPVDSIRPRRLTWTDSTPATTVLTQADTWELDNGLPGWQQNRGTPSAWYENQLQQQQVGIAPLPSTDGTIGLLYIALATTLNGAGVLFTVPDDWTPYIMYGTLSDLLNSDGTSFDPLRAEYCSKRFEEGVELAKLVLGGGE